MLSGPAFLSNLKDFLACSYSFSCWCWWSLYFFQPLPSSHDYMIPWSWCFPRLYLSRNAFLFDDFFDGYEFLVSSRGISAFFILQKLEQVLNINAVLCLEILSSCKQFPVIRCLGTRRLRQAFMLTTRWSDPSEPYAFTFKLLFCHFLLTTV